MSVRGGKSEDGIWENSRHTRSGGGKSILYSWGLWSIREIKDRTGKRGNTQRLGEIWSAMREMQDATRAHTEKNKLLDKEYIVK